MVPGSIPHNVRQTAKRDWRSVGRPRRNLSIKRCGGARPALGNLSTGRACVARSKRREDRSQLAAELHRVHGFASRGGSGSLISIARSLVTGTNLHFEWIRGKTSQLTLTFKLNKRPEYLVGACTMNAFHCRDARPQSRLFAPPNQSLRRSRKLHPAFLEIVSDYFPGLQCPAMSSDRSNGLGCWLA